MSIWKSTASDMVAGWITMRESEFSCNQADVRRKRTAREAHKSSADTQKMVGHKAKMHHAKRHAEKVQLKKTLKAHDERNVKQKDDGAVKEGALPTYLLDREGQKVGDSSNRLTAGRKSALISCQGSPKGSRCKVFRAAAKGSRDR